MKKFRLVILLALLAIFLVGLLKWTDGFNSAVNFGRDFAGYWAGVHLLLKGDDPYSPKQVVTVQRSLNWMVFDKFYSKKHKPIILYNPPYVLTFLMPFCMSNFARDINIWLICLISFLVFSSDRLWLIYGGPPETRFWALIVMITFTPCLLVLLDLNSLFFMLLGLVGFLYFVKKERWWLAGMMTVLIAIKPTLYLFWIALFLWSVKHRNWRLLVGSALTLLGAGLLPLFYNPHIYNQYFTDIVTRGKATYWMTPTLGTFLRSYFGWQHYWLQYIPILPGILWFIWYWHIHRNKWIWENQLPLLIFVSLITNFYTWPFDYLLILPAIIQIAVFLYKNTGIRNLVEIVLFYAIINVSVIVSALFFVRDNHDLIWIPYAFLINYLFAKKQLKKAPYYQLI